MKVSLIPNDFSQDLEKVFQLCQTEGVKYVELAYMWNKSILELNEAELTKVHELIDKYNLKAASIQTQIMKVHPPGNPNAKPGTKNMHDDFEFNISQIDTAIKLAKEFNAKYIVTYSFMDLKLADPPTLAKNWDLMFQVYGDFIKKLQPAGKTAIVECDGGQYVATIEDHLKLFEHFNSPHVMANFDLANLSHNQQFTRDLFEKFYKWVPYFHVKDRKINTGIKKLLFGGSGPAVFSEGSVPWRTVLPWFAEKGCECFLSVEPHVHGTDKLELGRQCVKNLQKTLNELNIAYE